LKETAKRKVKRKIKRPELLQVIIDSIREKKGENLLSLDLKKIKESVADYFVICEAVSSTQVSAIAGYIEKNVFEKLHEKPFHTEGLAQQEWVLIDYVDIIVHVFQPKVRAFYQLEDLWHDAALETYE